LVARCELFPAQADTQNVVAVCEQNLRARVAVIEDQLAGRPAWEMTAEEQRELARLTADFLRGRGARCVWLFGSMAKGRKLGVHSDFDFAVEGLPPEMFLGALGTLLQILPLPVDLVEMESASPFLRERILSEGVLL
jgi:predicted nucleotidyltransferase